MEGTSIARCPVMSAPGRVMPSTTFFNPRDPRFNDNPYQYYKRLREEDPVHKSALGAWFLSRYDDIRRTIKHSSVSVQDIPAQLRVKNQLLKTKKIAADQPDNLDALIDHAENWMAFLEGAKHARLRGLVSIAFERRAANAMRPFIRSAAIGLIEEAKQCGGMDLMKDFATVIPVRTMAETLGLPPESFPKLVAWINSIARIFDPLLSMKEYGELNQASRGFIDFLQELIPSRRLERRADLISALIDAQDRGNQLSERELISVIIILFGAGMDTTATLIGNAGLAFFNNPDHTKQLRSNLDLMPSAVEELLRYDAPLQMTSRTALEDLEIGGKQIRRGDQMYVILASGNRDPERFRNPDELEWTRTKNHHLSFAVGHHMCVGAPLARVMGQEALRAYLEMLPNVQPAFERIEYRPHTVIRAPTSIRVTFN